MPSKDNKEIMSNQKKSSRLFSKVMFIPLGGAFFLALLIFSFVQKPFERQAIPSPLLYRQSPDFSLVPLLSTEETVPLLERKNLQQGKVSVVNFFASWCPPCRLEHPSLLKLSEDKEIAIFGINYKDDPENALKFLKEYKNPFERLGGDPKGRGGLEWGIYGIPETFIVRGDGLIMYKHVGPITPEILQAVILPIINKVKQKQTS